MASMDLVGRCGIYCGACPVYRAKRGDGEALEFIVKAWKTPPNRRTCDGCQNLGLESHGVDCPRRRCMDEKGYAYCSECPECVYGRCAKWGQMDRYFRKLGVSLLGDVRRVKSGEAEAWQQEQAERWRCQYCGSPVFWEEKSCPGCGKPLK